MENDLSFADFERNREKYLGPDDEIFRQADHGTDSFRKCVQRHVYEIEGFRCKTLEEVEKIASDHGIPIKELEYKPQVIPLGSGKCDILVKFIPRIELDKRAKW